MHFTGTTVSTYTFETKLFAPLWTRALYAAISCTLIMYTCIEQRGTIINTGEVVLQRIWSDQYTGRLAHGHIRMSDQH